MEIVWATLARDAELHEDGTCSIWKSYDWDVFTDPFPIPVGLIIVGKLKASPSESGDTKQMDFALVHVESGDTRQTQTMYIDITDPDPDYPLMDVLFYFKSGIEATLFEEGHYRVDIYLDGISQVEIPLLISTVEQRQTPTEDENETT